MKDKFVNIPEQASEFIITQNKASKDWILADKIRFLKRKTRESMNIFVLIYEEQYSDQSHTEKPPIIRIILSTKVNTLLLQQK